MFPNITQRTDGFFHRMTNLKTNKDYYNDLKQPPGFLSNLNSTFAENRPVRLKNCKYNVAIISQCFQIENLQLENIIIVVVTGKVVLRAMTQPPRGKFQLNFPEA